MTDDTPFYAPPKSGEVLFEFLRERDYSRWRCELRDHGEPYGVEAQFYQNEEFLYYGRRFDRRMDPTRTPRALAAHWPSRGRRKSGRPSNERVSDPETEAGDDPSVVSNRIALSRQPVWPDHSFHHRRSERSNRSETDTGGGPAGASRSVTRHELQNAGA